MASVLHPSRKPAADGAESPPPRRRRRRWPWLVAVPLLLIGGAAIVMWTRHSPARPVSVEQAQGRFRSPGLSGPGDHRPPPGVYVYSGSGTDRLSLPPKSQAQGPTMPVTVALVGDRCWSMRIDYSTHHWQTWDNCLESGKLTETGGHLWQLWQVGPMNITNSTTLVCSPPKLVLPLTLSPGQSWSFGCRGTSSAVSGQMTSAGTLSYLGDATVLVAGKEVAAHHLVQTQTDSGAQQGTERYESWLAVDSGLPLRLIQDVRVSTSTPFGTSTYTQTGSLTATSLRPKT